MERDAAFAQKKAGRAVLRVHLREKYRLPKVSPDVKNMHSFMSLPGSVFPALYLKDPGQVTEMLNDT